MNWIPAGDILERERRIKTPKEIELLRQAEAIGDAAFSDILKILKPGMTELEVAAEIEYSLKKHGAEGLSFDTIAASGINSSKPHAIPGRKKLENGDFLTMDFGCIYEGYCSDMTRTFYYKEVSDHCRQIYELVRKANEAAEERIRPGVEFRELDQTARQIIEAAGYGDNFNHRLGHFIGLSEHEYGDVSANNTDEAESGQIFSIEPGIYLAGDTGVRIEDLVLVTDQGVKRLNNYPKELQIIG